jgi:hypothetical protein
MARRFSDAVLRVYANSAPINFRLFLTSTLVLSASFYVVINVNDRHVLALGDLERVATLPNGATSTPCGLAVPNTLALLQGMGRLVGDDAFTDVNEETYVDRVHGGVCSAASDSGALRAILQERTIPEACCTLNDTALTTTTEDALKALFCGTNADAVMGDFVRRTKHAYVLAAPAFARHAQNCLSLYNPFGAAICTLAEARTLIDTELAAAKTDSLAILSEGSVTTTPFPTLTQMLYRLLLLSVVEFRDRTQNNGICFQNRQPDDKESPLAFCTRMLSGTTINAFGPINGGIPQPSLRTYYAERIVQESGCDWTETTGTEKERKALEPPVRDPRRFSADYAEANDVLAACAATTTFGYLDRRRLFGIPDPVSDLVPFSPLSSNSFTRWVGGWIYWSIYDNKDKVVSETHTAYIDLKLYLGYRVAATSAYTWAAMAAAGYVLGFSACPLLKLLYTRCIRSFVDPTAKTKPIVSKPLTAVQYAALLTSIVVGLWLVFVDPAAEQPVVVDSSCELYRANGGPYATTRARGRAGIVGVVIASIAGGLLIYLAACRRPIRKDQVIPLAPFPLAPPLVLVLLYVIFLMILAILAGNEWWLAESISFASLSSRKSTADLEEVVVIGKWTLLLLGAWTGALNQRHTAANSVLGVARGKLPIFAYIYTAVIIALPSVATAISFPLFGCELGSSGSNLLVCGDDASSATAGRVLGGICFFLNILAVVFSLFAAYRLQKVPRSDSQATAIFNKSKELRVAQLARELNQTDRARSGEAPAAAPVPVAASYVAIGQDRLPLLSVRP